MARTPVVVLLAALAAAPAALADPHLTIERSFVPVADEAVPPPDTVQVWTGPDRVRLDGKQNTFVARFDLGELLIIDHVRKTFSRLELPIRLENLVPAEQAAGIRRMLEQAPIEVATEPAGETREIEGRTARKVVARIRDPRGLDITNTMWVTDAFGERFRTYERLQDNLAAMQPGGEWMRELTAVPGFAVVQEIEMAVLDRRQRRVERVVVADDTPVPAGGYAPPDGYEERPFNLMETVRGGS
jgi:hypothetical protein